MSLFTYQCDHDDHDDHDDDDYHDHDDNEIMMTHGSWYKLMKANWERAWRIKVATAKVIST